jgi:hypothetical protein
VSVDFAMPLARDLSWGHGKIDASDPKGQKTPRKPRLGEKDFKFYRKTVA